MSHHNNEHQPKTSAFIDKNFFQRLITTLVAGGLVVWLMATEHALIGYFMTIICVGVIYEWLVIVFSSQFDHIQRLSWFFLVSIYMVIGILGFYEFYDYNPVLGLCLLFVIWTSDISAYLCGRFFGGPKLAPFISPSKTWSGTIGGFMGAFILSLTLIILLYGEIDFLMLAFFSLMIVFAQVGDLLESKVKRIFGVKDSGRLVPGHGGLIDRLDSLFLIGVFLFAFHMPSGFETIFEHLARHDLSSLL